MFSFVAVMIIASVVSIALALYVGTIIGAARADGISASAALRYEARTLRRECAGAIRATIRAVIGAARVIVECAAIAAAIVAIIAAMFVPLALLTITLAGVTMAVVHARRDAAARRLDAARRRSAAVTFEQAHAACVLADAGVLPTRTIRRPIRRRPIVRAAMARGLRVEAREVKAIHVPAVNVTVEAREFTAHIHGADVTWYEADYPEYLYRPDPYRYEETCRRICRWAAKVGVERIEAMTFAEFSSAVAEVAGRTPVCVRQYTPSAECDGEIDFIEAYFPSTDLEPVPF